MKNRYNAKLRITTFYLGYVINGIFLYFECVIFLKILKMLITLEWIKKMVVHLDFTDLYYIIWQIFFLFDEHDFFSISNCYFCLKLCNLLCLHLWCHMAHLHNATFTLYSCALCVNQFRFRIPSSLTLHNCFSNHICQIAKISKVTLHTSVWSTTTVYRHIRENTKLQEEQWEKKWVYFLTAVVFLGTSLVLWNVNAFFYYYYCVFHETYTPKDSLNHMTRIGAFLYRDFPVAYLLYALQTVEWSHSLLKEMFVCYCVLDRSTVRREAKPKTGCLEMCGDEGHASSIRWGGGREFPVQEVGCRSCPSVGCSGTALKEQSSRGKCFCTLPEACMPKGKSVVSWVPFFFIPVGKRGQWVSP